MEIETPPPRRRMSGETLRNCMRELFVRAFCNEQLASVLASRT